MKKKTRVRAAFRKSLMDGLHKSKSIFTLGGHAWNGVSPLTCHVPIHGGLFDAVTLDFKKTTGDIIIDADKLDASARKVLAQFLLEEVRDV